MATPVETPTFTLTGVRDARRLTPRDVSPTIVVGCGGTGKEVLLRLRQRFLERYGALAEFPVVGYVMVDTDEATFSADAVAAAGPQAASLRFALNEQLFANLEACAPFIERPEVQEWWYPGLKVLGDVRSGTGQIRPYSRLAFYARYRELRTLLARVEREVRLTTSRNYVAERHGITTTGDLNVYFVSSLCGGTGSGMILDLAFLCRRLFPDAKLTSYLLFPHFFRGDVPKLFANSYATLKELETFQGAGRFTATYTDGEPIDQPPPPFDYCYVIGGRNGEAIAAGAPEMYDMLAANLFLDFQHSDFSAFKRGSRANLEQYALDVYVPPTREEGDDGEEATHRSCRYYSAGVTTVGFPSDRLVLACSYRLLSDVLNFWLGADRPQADLAALRAAGEESGHKAVHDALLMSGDKEIAPVEAPGALLQHGGRSLLADLRARVDQIRDLVAKGPEDEALSTRFQRRFGPLESEVTNPEGQWEQQLAAARNERQSHYVAALTQAMRRWLTPPRGQGVFFTAAALDGMLDELQRIRTAVDPEADAAKVTHIAEAKARVKQLMRGMDRHVVIMTGPGWKLNLNFTIEFDLKLSGDAVAGSQGQAHWASPIRREEGYLTKHLRRRAQVHYHAMCVALVNWVNQERRKLAEFRDELQTRRDRFRKAQAYYLERRLDTLDVVLISDADFDARFYRYPAAMRLARKGLEVVDAKYEAQVLLQGLGLLPATLEPDEKLEGVFALMTRLELLEGPVLALAKDVFRTIDQDHNVFDLLQEQYPDPVRRRAMLGEAFNRSKTWLREYTGHTLRIPGERRRCVVGLPVVGSPEMRGEVQAALRSFMGSRDGAIEFRTLPDPSALIIFNEVAGFPLCHINEVNGEEGLARHYERLSAASMDGQVGTTGALHSDSRVYRFGDVLFPTPAERQALAEAWTVLILGRVTGIVPYREGSYRFRVPYASYEADRRLGGEASALWTLSHDHTLRAQLLARCQAAEDRLLGDNRGRVYAAVLSWLLRERFAHKRSTVAGGGERLAGTVQTRVLQAKLGAIEDKLGADDRAGFQRNLDLHREEIARSAELGKDDCGFAFYDGEWWVLSRGESVAPEAAAGGDDFTARAQARLQRKFRISADAATEHLKRYVEMVAPGRPDWKLDAAAFQRLDELIDQVDTIEEFDLLVSAAAAGGFNA